MIRIVGFANVKARLSSAYEFIMEANRTLRALGLGHAVVELGCELVKGDPEALEHHQQVIHHVSRLVAQMVNRLAVFRRKPHGNLALGLN